MVLHLQNVQYRYVNYVQLNVSLLSIPADQSSVLMNDTIRDSAGSEEEDKSPSLRETGSIVIHTVDPNHPYSSGCPSFHI